ncbi:hypothetical protein [Bacillus sp. 179-C3.3 HS]|uniref:hypothetical protein n=1 Tax=Bacillus sp. 179-C3.3 HS TaxID=3232162 RepID=UPI0039A2315A
MKRKKLTTPQRMAIIVPFILVMASLLLFTKVSFNNKEIRTLTNSCYDVNGSPEVELSFLNLDYSFHCK